MKAVVSRTRGASNDNNYWHVEVFQSALLSFVVFVFSKINKGTFLSQEISMFLAFFGGFYLLIYQDFAHEFAIYSRSHHIFSSVFAPGLL